MFALVFAVYIELLIYNSLVCCGFIMCLFYMYLLYGFSVFGYNKNSLHLSHGSIIIVLLSIIITNISNLMKKLIHCVLVALVASTSWTSCSKDSVTEKVYEPTRPNSELLISLEQANQEFIQSQQTELRGFWDKFGKFCSVVTADALSGYSMGKMGGSVGAVLGPKGAVAGAAIGGTIGAIGGSYAAYKTVKGYNTVQTKLSYEQAQKAYIVAMSQRGQTGQTGQTGPMRSVGFVEKMHNDGIDIDFPIEMRASALSAGETHNLALGYLIEIEKGVDSLQVVFHPNKKEEEYIFKSTRMNDEYDRVVSVLSEGNVEALYEDLRKTRAHKIDVIMSLFVEVFSTYIGDINDINRLSNMYINRIERSNELTQEEKQILYNAISIAAHSYRFWEDQNKITDLIIKD